VHTGHAVDRGERSLQDVDGGLAVEQPVAPVPRDERGLVEEQDDTDARQPRRDEPRALVPRAFGRGERPWRACRQPSATPSVNGPVSCTGATASCRARPRRRARGDRRARPCRDALRFSVGRTRHRHRSGATATSGSAPATGRSCPRGRRVPAVGAQPVGRQRSTSSAAADPVGKASDRSDAGHEHGCSRIGVMGPYDGRPGDVLKRVHVRGRSDPGSSRLSVAVARRG
jgi:hypothetical protein